MSNRQLGRPHLLDGESLPPAPSQERSIAKRARLDAAALALFGERGYEATSIEEIAARARLAVGTYYQHYRSKRQLLLALMDDLLEKLSRLNLQPRQSSDIRGALRQLLSRAFSADLDHLGAYRAWREAMLSDPALAQKNAAIHSWTTARITKLFRLLQQHPGARHGADIPALATAMDAFFWSLLGQAIHMPKPTLHRQIDAATHLIFHALFQDSSSKQTGVGLQHAEPDLTPLQNKLARRAGPSARATKLVVGIARTAASAQTESAGTSPGRRSGSGCLESGRMQNWWLSAPGFQSSDD